MKELEASAPLGSTPESPHDPASAFGTIRRWRRPFLGIFLAAMAVAGLPSCGSDATGPDDDGEPGSGEYDHRRGAGESARDFLVGTTYDRLVVEIHWVEGHQPTSQGLQYLEDFLEARLNKPAGISIQLGGAVASPGQSPYSATEVQALESEHRSVYTEGRTLAAHVLFLDGEYAGGQNVLGIAYHNTSMALFQEQIESHTGGIGQPGQSTVEGTVAMHEFGHVMGLVDNGTPMQRDHQHEGRHCDDENCLMYFAVRTTDFLSNLLGGVPDLDQNCLDDLAANGGRA